MEYILLDKINSPQDLKKLTDSQCGILASETRDFLVNSVSKTGGHLSSNLGTVELTIALHRVFDCPNDKIIFDVSHQCYTHKILTGRRSMFHTLRQKGGLSGFTKVAESEYDSFVSGHSSTSISAALGIAKAFKLQNKPNYAVAVIGDGAFTGGQAYEALNNAGRSKTNTIVILNHNDMSISKNVGAFARYLTTIRARPAYLKFKHFAEKVLDHTPLIGKPIKKWLRNSKSLLKTFIYRSTFFEDLGFVYLGPVDGHNIGELNRVLKRAKELCEPVIIQVETIKGKGYSFAEENPGAFHATSVFNPEIGDVSGLIIDSYSDDFGKYLTQLADGNSKICAITAAMKYGTGLNHFARKYKDRFFDVGIAEGHAVTFAGGLASQGLIPVFAVYSSFLQRGFDQVIQDLSIDSQHVILAVDRAGIVGEDGETHQGIFDVGFLSEIPKITIYSPEGYEETRLCLKKAINEDSGVVALRYPRGNDKKQQNLPITTEYSYENNKADTLIISYGRIFSNCYKACELLKTDGINISLLKLTKIAPIDKKLIDITINYENILFVEEGIETGGIGQQFGIMLLSNKYKGNYKIQAINNEFIQQATVEQALESCHLDACSIADIIRR